MPRIRLSTRTVEPASLPRVSIGGGWREGLAARSEAIRTRLASAAERRRADDMTLRAVDAALDGALRLKAIEDRRAEREADEAVTAWETQMVAGIEGAAGPDGRPRGGIAQKSWQDYERGKTSPVTDLRDIEKAFQSSAAYKNLSGAAREKFERRVMTRRAQYLGTANRIYDRNERARAAFYDAQADLVGDRKVATTMLGGDDEFEASARQETFRKLSRKFRPLMENPDVADAPGAGPADIRWKDPATRSAFDAAAICELRRLSMGRCERLAELAGEGQAQWSGGRLVTNDEMLKRAEAYAAKLAEPTMRGDVLCPARIAPDEHESLKYRFAQARDRLDDRIRKAVASRGAAAMAEGDLPSLERAERELLAAAEGFGEGSAGRTAALLERQEIAKKADERAEYDIMDALANGRATAYDPRTQPRLSRLLPAVRQAWERKRYAANREGNMNAARAAMMDVIAGGNPHEFYNYLAKGVMDGNLSQKDYAILKDEFDGGWMKSLKGTDAQRSRQAATARGMLDAVKEKLGIDLFSAVKLDDAGDPALKDGMLEWEKDAAIPDATVRRVRGHAGPQLTTTGPGMTYVPAHDLTVSERIGGQKVKELLDRALSLWACDGMKLTLDPVTGKRLEKEHVVDALRDFKATLDALADERNVQNAAKTLEQRGAYLNNVRLRQADDQRRKREEMSKTN